MCSLKIWLCLDIGAKPIRWRIFGWYKLLLAVKANVNFHRSDWSTKELWYTKRNTLPPCRESKAIKQIIFKTNTSHAGMKTDLRWKPTLRQTCTVGSEPDKNSFMKKEYPLLRRRSWSHERLKKRRSLNKRRKMEALLVTTENVSWENWRR